MSANRSTARAVRLPETLDDAVMSACGGQAGFAEWARNVFRRAVGIPLNTEAGYEEGKMRGWAEANEAFRKAINRTKV
jgi:hypothetical protein